MFCVSLHVCAALNVECSVKKLECGMHTNLDKLISLTYVDHSLTTTKSSISSVLNKNQRCLICNNIVGYVTSLILSIKFISKLFSEMRITESTSFVIALVKVQNWELIEISDVLNNILLVWKRMWSTAAPHYVHYGSNHN